MNTDIKLFKTDLLYFIKIKVAKKNSITTVIVEKKRNYRHK